MSTLTKEDEVLIRVIKDNLNGYYTRQFQSLIDRLVAENEELRKNLNKTAEAHCETQRWWNADLKKLTALMDAVEPIVKAVGNCSLADDEGVVDEHIIKHYSMKDIKIGDLRALSTVVDGVRK